MEKRIASMNHPSIPSATYRVQLHRGFTFRDAEALSRARAAWKDAKSAGHDVTYWKESPSGKFEKQG